MSPLSFCQSFLCLSSLRKHGELTLLFQLLSSFSFYSLSSSRCCDSQICNSLSPPFLTRRCQKIRTTQRRAMRISRAAPWEAAAQIESNMCMSICAPSSVMATDTNPARQVSLASLPLHMLSHAPPYLQWVEYFLDMTRVSSL